MKISLRRIGLVLLAVMLALTAMVYAEETVIASGTCGAEGDGTNLTWKLTDDGTLTISGTGAMADYMWNNMPWYEYRESITTLVLEEGMTSIGNNAFSYLSSVSGTLTIPEGVSRIGEYAFERDSGFTGQLVLPESLESIEFWSFAGCSGLAGEVVIPENAIDVDSDAFRNATGINTFAVAEGNTVYTAVDGMLLSADGTTIVSCPCGKTGELLIPEGVTSIEASAFYNCDGLTGELILPESLVSIGSSAFETCDGLTGEILIQKNVTYIGSTAFRFMTGIAAFVVDEDNTEFSAQDGLLLNADGTSLLCCPGGKSGQLVIPESVTVVEAFAAQSNGQLTGLVLPENLQSVGRYALAGCTGLTGEVQIPAGVSTIGVNAFRTCRNLSGLRFLGNAPQIIGTGDEELHIFDGTIYYPASASGWSEDWMGHTCVPYGEVVREELNRDVAFLIYSNINDRGADSIFGESDSDIIQFMLSDGTIAMFEYEVPADAEQYVAFGDLTYDTLYERVVDADGTTYFTRKVTEFVNTETSFVDETAVSSLAVGADVSKTTMKLGDKTLAADEDSVLFAKQSYTRGNGETITQFFTAKIADLVENSDWSAYTFNPVTAYTYDAEIGKYTLAYTFVSSVGENSFPAIQQPTVVASGTCDGDSEGSITWTLTSDGVLKISGSGTANWGSGDAPWIKYRDSVTKIVIGSGFAGFRSNETYFPIYGCDSVTAFEVEEGNATYKAVDGVLYSADGTRLIRWPAQKSGSVAIPDTVTAIDAYAFAGTTDTGTLVIPAGVTEIERYALRRTAFTGLEVAAGNTSFAVYDGVLYNAELTKLIMCPVGRTGEVQIPDTVTSIAPYAFYDCTEITGELVLPEGLTEIGQYAFRSSGFTGELVLPASLTTITSNPFQFSSFASVQVAAGNTKFVVHEGALYSTDLTRLVWCPVGVSGTLNLPETLTTINERAICDCTELTGTLVLPAGLTDFHHAFRNAGFDSAVIPEGITEIDHFAFRLPNLTEITIPFGVDWFGNAALRWCNTLTAIYFEGHAPAVTPLDSTDGQPSFSEDVTLYYVAGTTGWTDSDAYDAEVGTWNGYKLEVWEGKTLPSYTLTVEQTAGGTVTLSANTAVKGATVTVTAAPAAGFELKQILVDGEAIEGTSFVVTGDHVVSAVFAEPSVIASGTCGADGSEGTEFAWMLTEDGTLTIQGNGTLTVGYNAPWEEYSSSICKISLGSGIAGFTKITFYPELVEFEVEGGNTAYQAIDGVLYNSNCTQLIRYPYAKSGDITILDTVTSIGREAFSYIDNERTLVLPAGLVEIGEWAFAYSKIAAVEVAAGNDSFTTYNGALYTKDLTELIWVPSGLSGDMDIPETVTHIRGSAAFGGRNMTGTLRIPAGVSEIEGLAFKSSYFSEIEFGEGLQSIGEQAFYGARNLSKITIPASVTDIGRGAFLESRLLESVYFCGNAPSIFDVSGTSGQASFPADATLYYIAGTTGWTDSEAYDAEAGTWNGYKLEVWKGEMIASGTTDNGITWSLDSNYTLEVAAPMSSGDLIISGNTPWYEYRNDIKKIVLGEGITDLYLNDSMQSLTEFELEEGNDAFCVIDGVLYNKALTKLIRWPTAKGGEVDLPDTITTIGRRAFYYTKNLTGTLTLPKGVETIEWSPFCGSNLSSVAVEAGNESFVVHNGVLYTADMTELVWCPVGINGELDIPETVTVIRQFAAHGATNLGTLKIPAGVQKIDHTAFGHSGITGLDLPEGLEVIYHFAFNDCDKLTEIVIPFGVTTIGNGAFRYSDNLTAIYFEGHAPAVTPLDSTDGQPSFSEDVTLYYVAGTTGWTDSEAYDAEAGTWNGYKLEVWEGKTLPSYTLTVEQTAGGTVTLSANTAVKGAVVTVTAAPAAGYELKQILVDGKAINGTGFTVTAAHTVSAVFEKIPTYNMTVGNVSNGTVTLDQSTELLAGTKVTVTAVPDAGYALKAIYVDGCTINGTSFTVSGHHVVTASFLPVSGSCGTNASWSVDLESGVLTISGSGAMSDYASAEAAPWYVWRESITEVVVEEGITAVGDHAFDLYGAEVSLRLPKSLQSVGDNAVTSTGRKVYYYIRTGEETTLNPHDSNATADLNVNDRVVGTLFDYIPGEDGTKAVLVPVFAAAEPTVDSSGLVWTIQLRRDAKWSDGTSITADDWIYSWKMAMDPKLYYGTGSSAATNFIAIKNAQEYYNSVQLDLKISWSDVGITKVDDYTITVETSTKYTKTDVMRQFEQRTMGVVKESIYSRCISADGTTCDYGSSLDKAAFAGKFWIAAWNPGVEIVFVKNVNWPLADLIHIDEMVSWVITDESRRIELFEQGEASHIDLGTNGFAKYGEDERTRSYSTKTINTIEVNQNHADETMAAVLNDPDFRKALFYATDRSAIAKLTNGTAAPYFLSTQGQSLDDGTQYRDTDGAKALVEKYAPNNGYDPDQAKELMESVLDKYGLEEIALSLAYTETSALLRSSSEYIQMGWADVFGGKVNLTLRVVSSSRRLTMMRESVQEPVDTWELCWSQWALGLETYYPWRKLELYTSTCSRRYTPYTNDALDAIYIKCLEDQNRLDAGRLHELTVQGEEALYEDMTCVPVFGSVNFAIFQEDVSLPMTQYNPSIGFGWEFADLTGRQVGTLHVTYAGTEEQWAQISVGEGNELLTAGAYTPHAAVTAPTCEEKGHTTYTCSCGESTVADYTPAKGHVFIDYVVNGDTETASCANGCGETHTREAAEEDKIIIEVPTPDVGEVVEPIVEAAVTVGKEVMEIIAESEKPLDFVSSLLNMTFNSDALKNLVGMFQEAVETVVETVEFIVENTTEEDYTDGIIFDLSVAFNGEKLEHADFTGEDENSAAEVEVDIPMAESQIPEGKTVEVWYLENGRRVKKMPHEHKDGRLKFKTTHFSEYEVAFVNEAAGETVEVSIENKTVNTAPATITAPTTGVVGSEYTFTVACDKACVVAYTTDGGATYTRVPAVASNGAYSFTVTLEENMQFVVNLKGDVNDDGVADSADVMLISRSRLSESHPAYRALSSDLEKEIGDANGDSVADSADVMLISRSRLSESHPAYAKLTWN